MRRDQRPASLRNLRTFAFKLTRLRVKKDLSMAKLAEAAGVSPAAITRYESGGRRPSGPVLDKLAEILDVDPTELQDDVGQNCVVVGDIFVGAGTHVGDNVILKAIGGTKISCGREVVIGDGAILKTSCIGENGEEILADIDIGNYAVIGVGVIVMPGGVIRDREVVLPGMVVYADLEKDPEPEAREPEIRVTGEDA